MSDSVATDGDMTMTDAATLVNQWPHEFHRGAEGAPVLLLMHGTGGNEVEISKLVAHLDPEATILAPRGRVTEQGMNRWFRRLGEGNFDVDDVIVRAGELAGFVEAAREHYGLIGQPLVAVGFSNGANIALATALLHPDAVSRVVALSGMYPFGDRDPITFDPAPASPIALLLLNGATDPMAPAASVRHLEAVATAHGVSVERHERAGGHGIDASELELARVWIQKNQEVAGQ
ncbi:alpha/beta hydrolase [Alpinimonas psychrophila]|uniref:Phospholipase/carboxylesterase n=1 Tax=Alpinimonas psychrophila TaxID=748908 RepID=A0A7W3JT10_9MICO|nr:alpha/beta hydrolase [Alpinimonas psychrophila]MBA8828733.1 phospholipase/carboxylesterase [Alpinimonas psychrophila]